MRFVVSLGLSSVLQQETLPPTCSSSPPWPWLWRTPQFAILHQRFTPIPSIPYLVPVPIIHQCVFWITRRLRCLQTVRFEALWNQNSGLQTNSSLLLHWQQWPLRRRNHLVRRWNRSHLEFFLCVWVRCFLGIGRYCYLFILYINKNRSKLNHNFKLRDILVLQKWNYSHQLSHCVAYHMDVYQLTAIEVEDFRVWIIPSLLKLAAFFRTVCNRT